MMFNSTSEIRSKKIIVPFVSDPNGSLGAQLKNHDKGLSEDIFIQGYATVSRLIEGETMARKFGVKVGDCIVSVNGEGFRRFESDDINDGIDDLKIDALQIDDDKKKIGEDQKLESRVVKCSEVGGAYASVLSKIKDVKKAKDPNCPLHIILERNGWDSRANAWSRFLAARNSDTPLAMKMMEEHTIWKNNYFPIDLSQEGIQKVLKSNAVSEINLENSKNNESPPTVYVDFSKIQALESGCSPKDVVDAFVVFTEKILSQASNPLSPKTSQFIDLTNTSITSGFRVDILKEVYAAFEPNYPETLHRMVMYPVSMMVKATFNMLLSFVNDQTRQKFILTDDLDLVCKELGWDKDDVQTCGGIFQYMKKHEKHHGLIM